MSDEPRLYTAEEAAVLLKIVTPAWLKRHAANGDIPSTPIGRKRVWTAAQLGEIVLGRQQKAVTSASRSSRSPAARGSSGNVAQLQSRPPRRKPAA